MKKALVIPEAFRSGKWSVFEQASKSHGLTAIPTKEGKAEGHGNQMHIPMGNTPIEKFVRMHELSHAKWFPDPAVLQKHVDITNPLINAIFQQTEDGRINYLMVKSGVEGVKEGATEFYESTFDRKDKDESLDHLLFIGITTWMFMPEYFNKRYASRLKKLSKDQGTSHWHILKRIRRLYQKHADCFEKSTVPAIKLMKHLLPKKDPNDSRQVYDDKTKELRDKLVKLLEELSICFFIDKIIEKMEEKKLGYKGVIERGAKKLKEGIKQARLDKLIGDEKPLTKTPVSDSKRQKRNIQDFVDMGLPSKYVRAQFMDDDLTERERVETWAWNSHLATWGTLSIEEAKLVKTISKKPAVKEVNSDEGSLIGQIYRAPIDGMIFTEIHRNYREGSVLIDCSGSMSISIQEIERIVKLCPGMIVAGYAGSGEVGILRIFAKGGKMCETKDLDLGVGGNIVDFPALEWLAGQKNPRFWISDGRVTGKKEVRSTILVEQAFTFIANHKILRITNVKLLEEHFLRYRI